MTHVVSLLGATKLSGASAATDRRSFSLELRSSFPRSAVVGDGKILSVCLNRAASDPEMDSPCTQPRALHEGSETFPQLLIFWAEGRLQPGGSCPETKCTQFLSWDFQCWAKDGLLPEVEDQAFPLPPSLSHADNFQIYLTGTGGGGAPGTGKEGYDQLPPLSICCLRQPPPSSIKEGAAPGRRRIEPRSFRMRGRSLPRTFAAGGGGERQAGKGP